MDLDKDDYRISKWLLEFKDRAVEEAYQSHVQRISIRQLRMALGIWAALLLAFTIPDYVTLGLTRPFYYLFGYRLVMVASLLTTFLNITPKTNFFKTSYFVALIVVIGFSGFMLFFVYRPDITHWIIGVLMLEIIGLMMFLPMRFFLAFLSGLYGVLITFVTRWVMGSSKENLIGLFFLLILPFVTGATVAIRFNVLQRKEFASLARTERINKELQKEIQRRLELEETLRELAATDPLTGLYNRREYETLFQHEMDRAKRADSPLSLCIIDLDHFKLINDTYGHGAGDEVLRRTADILQKELRAADVIGRLGGEEFIILLPDTTIDQAVTVGNRLLQKLAATDIVTGTATLRVSATLGLTQLFVDDKDINGIIRRADTALYKGKEMGRNRVEIAMV